MESGEGGGFAERLSKPERLFCCLDAGAGVRSRPAVVLKSNLPGLPRN